MKELREDAGLGGSPIASSFASIGANSAVRIEGFVRYTLKKTSDMPAND